MIIRDLHAAHGGLRLTSADFLLYFNSISRNKRHDYVSLGSRLLPLLFISVVLHSESAIGTDCFSKSNILTDKTNISQL